MGEELAALVRRRGGEPLCVPAVREERTPCGAELAALLDALPAEPPPVFVLTTGVGVAALFAEAHAAGRAADLRSALARATLVCRGPKPAAALRREGLDATVPVPEPYTTAELLGSLAAVELAGRWAVLIHYGERSVEIAAALADRGARLRELLLYEWRRPVDPGPLQALAEELVQGRVGAALFTSQAQARHLFEAAAEAGRAEALRAALRTRAAVGAVGPTCARALEALGAPPHFVPSRPKMGPLVTALAEYLSTGRSRS
jgi:uroporphyrinogen-III synthase